MPSCSSPIAAFRISTSCLAFAGRAVSAATLVPSSTAAPATDKVLPVPRIKPRRDGMVISALSIGLVSSFGVEFNPGCKSQRGQRAPGQPLAIGAGELQAAAHHIADLRIERLHELAPRSQMPRLNSLRRDTEDFGRFFHGESFDLP